MRGRSFLPLLFALASLALTAPAYADQGHSGHPGSGTEPIAAGTGGKVSSERQGDRATLPDPAKSPEPAKAPELPKIPDPPKSGPSPRSPGAAGAPAAMPRTTRAASKAVAAARTVYVMRGFVVQVVAPSASAVGSVSFRVTASSRLATRVRGMVITLALTKPTKLRKGSPVAVRLRAPVDAMAFGFDSATALTVTASG